MTYTLDSKLIYELESIRSINLGAYLSIKQNIAAVHQKILVEDAERSFLHKEQGEFLTYRISSATHGLFTTYLGIKESDIEEIWLYIKGFEFLTVFCLNAQGYVIKRVHMFDHASIADIIQSFNGCFLPIPELAPVEENFSYYEEEIDSISVVSIDEEVDCNVF